MNPVSRRDFLRLAGLTGLGFVFGRDPLAADASNGPASPGGAADLVYVEPGSPAYERLRRGFNRRIDRHPKRIALCRTTAAVAEAVAEARRQGWPVAVKSGGHCFEGFSANDDGWVVNVSPMNRVDALSEGAARVGPGCTLERLYDSLLPSGRLIPAGSCGGVGIGGLTLGGGYGFFSRRWGLTCDSLMEATMVDGNGRIVSSRSDAELLWALRGGGNGNFGIVTELTFQTQAAPSFFQSHRFHASALSAARAASLLKTWFEATDGLPDGAFSAFVLSGPQLTILVTHFEDDAPGLDRALAALKGATERETIGARRAVAPALRTFYGVRSPLYFKNASAGFYHGFHDLAAAAEAALGVIVAAPGLLFQVNTLGGRVRDPAFDAASAFPYRDRPFLAELQSYWDEPGGEGPLLERFARVQSLLKESGVSAHYVNYPDRGFSDYATAYYDDRYRRLQAIKRRYDPDDRIRHPQSVRL